MLYEGDAAKVIAETPDGVICLGAGEEVVFANQAAERIFRRERSGLEGKRWGDLVEGGSDMLPRPGSQEERLAHAQRARARRPDGSTVEIEVSIALHTRDSSSIFWSAIVRDLTASDRSLSASQLAGERQSFLSSAAHQLRAPIQPILTSLRTIEQALKHGTEPPGDTVPRALRQTLRLGRLVDAILRDVAAVERDRLDVEITSFDLAELVGEIVDDFRLAAPGRRFELRAPAGPVQVSTDRVRVHQILVSLLDNAMKYSERERRILVEVASPSEGVATVSVSDEGIGIPADEQERIFSKFYRASNAPAEASGLGIGLFLAHGLAERLRGKLSVRSQEGFGSTFVLTLPQRWTEAERSPSSRASGSGDGARERV